jgi:hypothetical protein
MDMIEVARRAVTRKNWRWVPGMLNSQRVRVMDELASVEKESLPDFNDYATLGCLQGLVREVWGEHMTTQANSFEPASRVWRVYDGRPEAPYGQEVGWGHTEAEALVAALELSERPGAMVVYEDPDEEYEYGDMNYVMEQSKT